MIIPRLRIAGVDLFCLEKKFLVFNFVNRNLKIKYRRSILGVFWTLMNPLALAGMYYVVFHKILKIEIPQYLPFVLSGVLLWNFFSSTISEGLDSLVGNFGLLSKISIPIQVFPWVGSLTNLVNLLISMPVILGFAYAFGGVWSTSLVTLPYFLSLLFVLAYGISVVLGIGYVYLRDLRHLVQLGLQLWFYGTPVLYQEQMIPERFRGLLLLNPVSQIFIATRRVLLTGDWPTWMELLHPLAWAALILTVAVLMIRRIGPSIPEAL